MSIDNDPLIGGVLGDYTINRLIARGGMGRVYEATDNHLDRKVAVKVITLDEEEAIELMERFQREGQVIGQLDDHPNIITIYRYGTEQGVHYIAMKYIQGESLSDLMKALRDKSEYLDVHEMLAILRQVAQALDYAHQHGVIHRDVKPANVMLESDPSGDPLKVRAILMDFGLVMRMDTTVTSGTAFGTPLYISPEQAMSSQEARPQSDIYSLGVVTYEILTGRPPFDDRDSPIAVALSHVTKSPTPPSTWRKDLPPGLDAVMMKVLDKEPNNRYQRAIDFVEALEGVFAVTQAPSSPPQQQPAGPRVPREPIIERRATPAPKKKRDKKRDKRSSARAKSGRRDHILPSLILFVLLIGVGALAFIIMTGESAQSTDATQTVDAASVDETEVAAANETEPAPSETPIPPSDTPVPPSDTPVPASDTPVPPSDTAMPASDTPVPPSDTAMPASDTPVPPSDTPVPASDTPAPPEPTEVAAVVDGPTGNLELYFQGVTLTVRNPNGHALPLGDMILRQDDREFALSQLGASTMQAGMCGYVTVLRTEFERPTPCLTSNERPPLEFVQPSGFVWVEDGGQFEVVQNGAVLGSCQIDSGRCTVSGVQLSDN